MDAHALLHEPKQRGESVEVRRRRQNEAVGFRDRVVDVAEEFHVYVNYAREYADDPTTGSRSGRREREGAAGRQAEKETLRSRATRASATSTAPATHRTYGLKRARGAGGDGVVANGKGARSAARASQIPPPGRAARVQEERVAWRGS